MVLPTTLTMASARGRGVLASRSAASVSAVSPDWEMTSARCFFERRVAVTKFVREFDLHRDLREFLNQILATSAACQLVPLAAMTMRSIERNSADVKFRPPNLAVAPSLSTRPRRAFSTVRGCS